jgi:hypothetical protein
VLKPSILRGADSFVGAASGMRVGSTVAAALEFIIERAARDIGPSSGAGLSLLTVNGRRITSVATDPTAERLNTLHDLSIGSPCKTAHFGRTVVRVGAMPLDEPWSRTITVTSDIRVGSMMVAAVHTETRLLGTLLVYSREPAAYTCADETRLRECARDAAILVDEVQSARAAFRSTVVK